MMSRGSQPTRYTAYQLNFNPAQSDWDGKKEDWWPCYTTKVQPDDEVFLIRTGNIPKPMKGIVGRGIATSATYPVKASGAAGGGFPSQCCRPSRRAATGPAFNIGKASRQSTLVTSEQWNRNQTGSSERAAYAARLPCPAAGKWPSTPRSGACPGSGRAACLFGRGSPAIWWPVRLERAWGGLLSRCPYRRLHEA
jgi:hypothetical protein